MTNQSLFERYANIRAERDEAQAQMDSLALEILAEMEMEGLEKAPTTWGTFSKKLSPTYEYSAKVEKEADKLAEMKKKEREEGTAKMSGKVSLIFTSKKENA